MLNEADTSNVRTARERFEETRRAVDELHNVQLLIMYDGEDWRPNGVRVPGISDPTAIHAIRNVDEWGEQLIQLRKRESELIGFIGVSVALVQRIRETLGEKYANVLDARFIELQSWERIKEEQDVTRQYGHYLINIACDYIDSVGVSRLLNGDAEI